MAEEAALRRGRPAPTSPVLLLIFGAGASYDSSPTHRPGSSHHEERPPLADDLFEERPQFLLNLQRFPECFGVIANLRHRHPTKLTVEQALDRLLQEAERNPGRHVELMAIRYYLHFNLTDCIRRWVSVHGGIENYVTLLSHVEQWRVRHNGRVVIVTFNYDTMIETALQGRGVATGDMDDYTRDPRYKLIKVHGSANWARSVIAPAGLPLDPGPLIRAASQLKFGEWSIATGHPVSRARSLRGDVPAVPAIALPLQRKTEFECPPSHLEALTAILPEVSKCLVIGWRGSEQHFTSLLCEGIKRRVPWMIAASRGGTETIQNLQAARVPGEFTDSNMDFSDFIIQRKIYDFLDA